jgi:hypothetical protein
MATIAAPSRVIPGTPADNFRFLAGAARGKIREIGLCLFETEACLAYTEEELPSDPACLPFSLHAHLPVDLPWHGGAEAAAARALRLMDKIEPLAPRAAVLHMPALPDAAGLLRAFSSLWRSRRATPLLLENTDTSPPALLADLVANAGFGLCLDMAHMAAYRQEALMESRALVSRAALVHWSAPGGADRHLPLTRLTTKERALFRSAAKRLPPDPVHLIEVFDWKGVEESLTVLSELIYAQ